MASFGVNIDPRQGYAPIDVVGDGVPWLRSVLTPDDAGFPSWIARVHEARGKVLGVIARESFRRGWTYAAAARFYARRYGAGSAQPIDAWQIGNEPDQTSASSWGMPPTRLARLIAAFRQALPAAILIGPGLASGDPGYWERVEAELGSGAQPLNAIAIHPYGQSPAANFRFKNGWAGFGRVQVLLGLYGRFGKPLWVTEFGGEADIFVTEHHRALYHSAMIEALAPLCSVACVFCWSDRMVDGYGLIDAAGNAKETYASFYDAAAALTRSALDVTWIGSPNYSTGRLRHAPIALVLHTMAGTLAGCDSWFRNPASEVSAHFGVGLDGAVHQYVQLTDTAWANGSLEAGNRWPGDRWTNPNYLSVSIETEDLSEYPDESGFGLRSAEGQDATPVSDAQYSATLAVARLALARFPSIRLLVAHRAISPQTRPSCPGDRWITSGRCAALARELGLGMIV